MGGGPSKGNKIKRSTLKNYMKSKDEKMDPEVFSAIANRFMIILQAKEGRKIDSKVALRTSKIPLASISQIPELQLNPLLGRLLETAREDIDEDEIDFEYFVKILKVLSPDTDPTIKKRLLFRMIDITGDEIITRREFVLFFINVFCSRSHFNEDENEGVSRQFLIGGRQINECYRNIDNILSGVSGITSNEPESARSKPQMDKNINEPNRQINIGPSGETNADQQLKFEDFEKLVTDEDAFQYLTIYFY
ncbi:unnamed protein product [Moneuplotes crassus]|uniref:EF-hand domain-containing protein n=1 Tax=Euplotes crassus TaxID=5936 RepID=A0AAD1XUA1_EUPCR|nr:unnamed protein product [Moneuplotes crassus]